MIRPIILSEFNYSLAFPDADSGSVQQSRKQLTTHILSKSATNIDLYIHYLKSSILFARANESLTNESQELPTIALFNEIFKAESPEEDSEFAALLVLVAVANTIFESPQHYRKNANIGLTISSYLLEEERDESLGILKDEFIEIFEYCFNAFRLIGLARQKEYKAINSPDTPDDCLEVAVTSLECSLFAMKQFSLEDTQLFTHLYVCKAKFEIIWCYNIYEALQNSKYESNAWVLEESIELHDYNINLINNLMLNIFDKSHYEIVNRFGEQGSNYECLIIEELFTEFEEYQSVAFAI